MPKEHKINNDEKKLILEDLNKLIKILSKSLEFDSAILFGSFLKSNEFNDIDLLLIKNKNLEVENFINLYSKIIELNEVETFENFYLTYYDSNEKPKGKIKISLELDSPFMKELLPEFYEKTFFIDKSFKVLWGHFDPKIYLDKNILFDHKKFLKYRELIKYLHTTPNLLELISFCKNKK